MSLDLGGDKKKKDKKSKYSIIDIDLFKPSRKKCSIIDYEDLRRNQLKEGESSGDDERFHDKEAMELVRRLEAKYGKKKSKSGKKVRFGTEDDFIDKGAGYDLEDGFIDDSEAYDELIPSTMDTAEGGFYVNKGRLEFKSKDDHADVTDISDDDEPIEVKKPKKKIVTSDNDMDVVVEKTNKSDSETSAPAPVVKPVAPVPSTHGERRMTGAPPTKKFASGFAASPTQIAAQGIKRRLLGRPPTLNKNKLFKPTPKTVTVPDCHINPTPSSNNLTSSSRSSPEPSEELEVVTSPKKDASTMLTKPSEGSSDGESLKKDLPEMSETLEQMIANFKKQTENLAAPGQKKRLQNIHVDMVVAIDDQCVADKMSLHKKSRVLHHLADFCGIQKTSLYSRLQKRKDEKKEEEGNANAPSTSTASQPPVRVPSPAVASTSQSASTSTTTAPKPAVQWTPAQIADAMIRLSTFPGFNKEHALKLIYKNGLGTYESFLKSCDDIGKTLPKPADKVNLKDQMDKLTTNGTPTKDNIIKPSTSNNSVNVPSTVSPDNTKITIAQQIQKQKKCPITSTVAPTSSQSELIVQLKASIELFGKAVDSGINSCKLAHEQKKKACLATGRPLPKFVVTMNENQHTLLKEVIKHTLSYIQSSKDSIDTKYDALLKFLSSSVLPFFKGHITLGKLCVEYIRRNPDHCLMLAHPSFKKVLDNEKIDLNSITILNKNTVSTAPIKVPTPSTTSVAKKSSEKDDDDIQFVEVHKTTPSTSNVQQQKKATPDASTSSAVSKTTTSPKATIGTASSSFNTVSGLVEADVASIQRITEQMTLAGMDAAQIQTAQQLLVLQALQNAKTNGAQAKLKAAEEKEKKKQEKEELKQKAIMEKRAELMAQKEQQRKQKMEEKNKKAEEERLKRLEEQSKREKQIQEERERQLREEMERKKHQEELERLEKERKLKEEQELEKKRNAELAAQMREEEENAAQLLQAEVALDSGDVDFISEEMQNAREKERLEEEERVRKQQEQAAAARAAAMEAASSMEQKPVINHKLETDSLASCSQQALDGSNYGSQPSQNGHSSNNNSQQSFPMMKQEPTVFSSPSSSYGHVPSHVGQSPVSNLVQSPANSHISNSPAYIGQSPSSTHVARSPAYMAQQSPARIGHSPAQMGHPLRRDSSCEGISAMSLIGSPQQPASMAYGQSPTIIQNHGFSSPQQQHAARVMQSKEQQMYLMEQQKHMAMMQQRQQQEQQQRMQHEQQLRQQQEQLRLQEQQRQQELLRQQQEQQRLQQEQQQRLQEQQRQQQMLQQQQLQQQNQARLQMEIQQQQMRQQQQMMQQQAQQFHQQQQQQPFGHPSQLMQQQQLQQQQLQQQRQQQMQQPNPQFPQNNNYNRFM